MQVGERINRKRKAKKISLRAFQEEHGIHKDTLSNIENNKTSPTVVTLQKIAKGLGCEAWELLK